MARTDMIDPRITRMPGFQGSLDPCQQQALDAVEGQMRLTSWPYYSRVKFVARRAVSAGAAFQYDLSLPTDGIRAFSYPARAPKTAAGYTVGDGNATIADTNLTNANQTIGGQNVLISGLAMQWVPAGSDFNTGDTAPPRERWLDYRFVAALHDVISVELSLNGDENSYRLGILGMVPGAGGLMNGGEDQVGLAALDAGKSVPVLNNGWATKSNFFRVPEGLIWRSQGNSDSMLNLIFRQQRALRIFSGGTPENNVLGIPLAAVAGASRGVNYPTELVAELMVFLIGSVIGPRTRSA